MKSSDDIEARRQFFDTFTASFTTYLIDVIMFGVPVVALYVIFRLCFTSHEAPRQFSKNAKILIEENHEPSDTRPEFPMPTEAYGEVEVLTKQVTPPYPTTMPEPEVVAFREPIKVTRTPRRTKPIVDTRRKDETR